MQEKESTQQIRVIEEHHYKVLKETLELYKEYKETSIYLGGNQDFDHHDFMESFHKKIQYSFFDEYIKFRETHYFLGCSFKVYNKTYSERLEYFKNIFIDSNEIDFIISELNEGIFEYRFKDFESSYIEDFEIEYYNRMKKNIFYSLKKRFLYLKQRAELEGFNLVYIKDNSYSIKPIEHSNTKTKVHNDIKFLSWNGTNLQLTELIKSLIESNLLNHELSQKEIFKRFTDFLQVDEFDENDKIRDIRKRTHTKTPLLNLLEKSINSYITNKD